MKFKFVDSIEFSWKNWNAKRERARVEWGKRFCIREEARGREERVGWNWREIGRFAWLISYTPFSQVAETLIIPSRLEGDFFPRLSRGLLIVITSRLNYPCSGYCNGKPMIIYNIIYSVLIKFLNTNEAWATPQKLILHSIQSDIRNFQKKNFFPIFRNKNLPISLQKEIRT